jgi:pimeloyl-ACP methyl ester carboxylesterase
MLPVMTFRNILVFGSSLSALVIACSSSGGGTSGGSSGTTSSSGDMGSSGMGSSGMGSSGMGSSSSGMLPGGKALMPSSPCADTVESIYADPGAVSGGAKGKILKCAKEADLTAEAINARLPMGTTPTKVGANVYRVLYQTERGDKSNSIGYASAVVVVPQVVADNVGIAVVASGTRGQAGACAASKVNKTTSPLAFAADSSPTMLYAAVAGGRPAILHDSAGYANFGKNLAPGYAFAADTGKSMLDGVRAMKELFPAASPKTFLIGHSHGGHIVLSALALSDTYGAGIELAGVVLNAPYWTTQRNSGALLSVGASQFAKVSLKSAPLASGIAIWYHLQHADALDGPGEGIKLIKPEYRAKVQKYYDEYCLLDPSSTQIASLGTTYVAEVFVDELTASVGNVAAGTSSCATPLCETWMARYKADRPRLSAAAAKVPMLINYGGNDGTIPKDRMSCGLDFLGLDKKDSDTCYVAAADHTEVVGQQAGYSNDWMNAKLTGKPAPSCEAIPELDECNKLPPNMD